MHMHVGQKPCQTNVRNVHISKLRSSINSNDVCVYTYQQSREQRTRRRGREREAESEREREKEIEVV